MSLVKTDLGAVTNYAYAVEHGYFEGTEEEYNSMMAQTAQNAQICSTSAESASADAETATIKAAEAVAAAATASAAYNTDIVGDNFSTAKNYSAGDYVIYDGSLYRFTADHAAGAWKTEDPDAIVVAIANDVSDLRSALDELNEYNFEPGTSISYSNDPVNNITIGSNGYAKQQTGYKLYRYAVTAGDKIYLKITSDDYTGWQFQSSATSEGTYRIGTTHSESIDDILVAPIGATHLAVGNSSMPTVMSVVSSIRQLENETDALKTRIENDVNSIWNIEPFNGSAISWENKRISANTGDIIEDNARLKSVNPLPSYVSFIGGTNYDFGLFAYLNDTYIGWWTGAEWSTANLVWSPNSIVIPYRTNGYAIYLVAKKKNVDNISSSDAVNFNIYSRIYSIENEIGTLDNRVTALENVGNNYALASDFTKKKISYSLLGTLKYVQSFLIYDGKYYSTDGSHIAVQDDSFSLLDDVTLSVGHGNAFCLGKSNKGYISGWDDNTIYVIDLDNVEIDSTIALPTTGYTTAAVDDENGIAYIFQRDTYPSTKANYNLIAYDYINQQTLYTVKTSVPYAAMQACDIYRDRIIVLFGSGTSEKPNGYIVYGKSGDILGEYILGDFSAIEPEGIFIDRTSHDIYFSEGNRLLYRLTM